MFPAFICANNIGSLVNNLLGVKVFNLVSIFFLFRGFNSVLSAIVSSGYNFTFSSPPTEDIGGKSSSSKYKSIAKFSGTF